jgi:hypothetical protein
VNNQQKTLGLIILLGGLAVVGSYVYAALAYPSELAALWGDVPSQLLPIYTANMFLGAAGFFAYSFFVLFRIDPEQTMIFNKAGYSLFYWIYLGILVPSALWTPLALQMLAYPSTPLWLLTRLVLAVTGLSSLALLAALITLRPRQPGWAYGLAVMGVIFFCFQTVILDAVIWPAFFPF